MLRDAVRRQLKPIHECGGSVSARPAAYSRTPRKQALCGVCVCVCVCVCEGSCLLKRGQHFIFAIIYLLLPI